ncbi:MAG: DUF1800 domain-containing protein [Candidatus Velthaea sp.]
MPAAQPAPYRPAGDLNVATALAPYAGTWDRRRAAHLLRRAGFGGTPDDVTRLAAMRMNGAVDSLVQFADASQLPPMPELQPLYPALQRKGAADPEAARAAAMQANRLRVQEIAALQTWWLNRMISTPAPLQEKMTLFLHGHFTSAPGKGVQPSDLAAQNQLYRQSALGNFHELAQAVSRDPAMLLYLDNARSAKAHPNENYARELMELFTLGIGNYTENDVRESARAFTGWSVRRGQGFVFNARQHDDGVKTFLGQTGNFDGNNIVDIIFQQPAASRRLAERLISYFVYDDPEPALVDAFAAVIRKNNFELQPSVSTLLRSNVFYSDRAYRALVKSPVEFVVGAYQTFGIAQVDPVALNALRRMGQVLFNPPSVKGWDGGAAWLNSQTVLTRENFASALMANPAMTKAAWLGESLGATEPETVARTLTQTLLFGDVSPASMARLVGYLNGAGVSARAAFGRENADERVRTAAYLTMAMPAYQLN